MPRTTYKEELRVILLDILRIGLLRMRVWGWNGKAGECADEADFLHNLPDMIRDMNIEAIVRFYNFNLTKIVATTGAYEAEWRELGTALNRMQSRGTKRLTFRGVFKVLSIGYVAWVLGALLFLIGYGIFSK
jgi:hypothetical protein